MKRVFILSRCPLLARGLACVLQQESNLDIVGVDTNPTEAMGYIAGLHPDIVIVDDFYSTGTLTRILDRVLQTEQRIGVIEVASLENSLCIYHREHRSVEDVSDLLQAIQELTTTVVTSV